MPKTRSLPGCTRNNINNTKGGIRLHFHFDTYKCFANDRREQLIKEASRYRLVTKTKYKADKRRKRKMLFRSFFNPGKTG